MLDLKTQLIIDPGYMAFPLSRFRIRGRTDVSRRFATFETNVDLIVYIGTRYTLEYEDLLAHLQGWNSQFFHDFSPNASTAPNNSNYRN